jgi:hypothetical protein
MKKILSLSLMALVLVLGACGDDEATNVDVKKEETPKKEVKTEEKINVDIEVNEEITGGKATFTGTTNLPDDSELMITLSNENGYKGQTKVVVENGVFESETFSNKGVALDSGTYQVKVTMSISNTQPESVQKVIGDDSKNLEGELVEDGEIGRTVSYSKDFEI